MEQTRRNNVPLQGRLQLGTLGVLRSGPWLWLRAFGWLLLLATVVEGPALTPFLLSYALHRNVGLTPALIVAILVVSYSAYALVSPSKGEIAELRQDRPVRWFCKTVIEAAPWVLWLPQFRRFSRLIIDPMDKDTQVRVNSVTVIVDVERASGAALGQLSDYIAFVALGDPELGANFSPVSIMSLYNNDQFNAAAPSRMTRFDESVLYALFNVNPARAADDEQAEISTLVRERLANQNTASR